jgi:hypothetical protein
MIHRDEVPIIPLLPPDGTFIGRMYMMPDFSSWEFPEKSDVENNNVEKDK